MRTDPDVAHLRAREAHRLASEAETLARMVEQTVDRIAALPAREAATQLFALSDTLCDLSEVDDE